jgi:hypothetical protein
MKINYTVVKRLLASLLVVGCAGSILFSCGGSGSDGSSNSKTNNGGMPIAPGSGVNPGLSGQLWLRELGPSAAVYNTMEALSGVESLRFIGYENDSVTPSPDGQRFVIAGDTTFNDGHIRIHDVLGPFDNSIATLEGRKLEEQLKTPMIKDIYIPGTKLLYKFSQDHRFLGILMSPGSGGNASVSRNLVIIDLRNPNDITYLRQAYNKDGNDLVVNFTWLPNGQYMYLRKDLQLVRGQVSDGGTRESIVSGVQVPQGLSMNTTAFEARPQGDQLIVSFVKPGSDVPLEVAKNDIWLINTDGTNPQQVSAEGRTLRAVWSPSGETILLQSRLDGYCDITGRCLPGSYCNMWYVSKETRKANPDSQPNIRRIENGKPSTGNICGNDAMNWTQ